MLMEANSSLSGRSRARQSSAINTAISPPSFSPTTFHHPAVPVQKKPRIDSAGMHTQYTQQQWLKMQQEKNWKRQHRHRPLVAGGEQLIGRMCINRVMMFINQFRKRPIDNSTLYWETVAAEFFEKNGRQRWCFSTQNDVPVATYNRQRTGLQPTEDAWGCDHCGARSGKGFEATFEILPRIWQIKFEHGLIEELFFLGMPRGTRFPSGILMLEFAKATQQCNYVQELVVQEGHLRIIFTPNLKMLSWEFCVTYHEEFFSRNFLAPQVNLFYDTVQNYQTVVIENGFDSLSPEILQRFCNMLMIISDMLMKSLEPQSLTRLGLSNGFAHPLQVSEVGCDTKNSIDVSQDYRIGPLDFSQEPHPVANIAQQNDITRFSDASYSLNRTKEVPKQSFGDPSTSGYVEDESAIIRSGSRKNGSGSANSPTSISNVERGTMSRGYRELRIPSEGVLPSSSDHTSTPKNLQSQEDNFWNEFTDRELFSLFGLLA